MLHKRLVCMLDIVQHMAQPNLLCSWADCIVATGQSYPQVLLNFCNVCCALDTFETYNMVFHVLLPSLQLSIHGAAVVHTGSWRVVHVPFSIQHSCYKQHTSRLSQLNYVHAGIQDTLHGEGSCVPVRIPRSQNL